ncbi:MAG: hypothetical protein A2135_10020 [Actinobacteria bacterium RBG_16_67_15]|nr:MAG: hypothetical protein A2135_10020 [Actinobacteria bacterium RBG_16_67_15]
MSGADGSGTTTGVDMIALATSVGRIETAVQYLKEQGDRRDAQTAELLSAFDHRVGNLEKVVTDLAARMKVMEGNGTLLRSSAPGIATAILAAVAFLMGLGALINYGG